MAEDQLEASEDGNQAAEAEDQDFDNLEAMAALIEDTGETRSDNPDEGEAEDTPEGESADEAGGEESEAGEDESDSGQEITLSSGETISLEEIEASIMRQRDYTQKTMELADQRKNLDATFQETARQGQALQTTFSNLLQFMQSLVPDEPSYELSQSNPGEAMVLSRKRQDAIAELEQLMQAKAGVDQQVQEFDKVAFERWKAEQDAALVKAMPGLANAENRAKFDQAAKATAKAIGYPEERIAAAEGNLDHLDRMMLHYAGIGLQAVKNRAKARKSATEAPKTARPKRTPSGTKGGQTARQRELWRRAEQTGDIDDILAAEAA